MKDFPERKHPRLKGYDYSRNGSYFLTFCVKGRRELLGRVFVGRGILDAPYMELTDYGNNLVKTIDYINANNNNAYVEKYVIMPNHVHLIAVIDNPAADDGASRMPRPTNASTVNALIPKLMSSIKRQTNKLAGFNMWQTSYYDHIIRNIEDYVKCRAVIDENPGKWEEDEYYRNPSEQGGSYEPGNH